MASSSGSGGAVKRHHENDMVNEAVEHYRETIEARGDMDPKDKEIALDRYRDRMNQIWNHPDRPANRKS